MLFAEIFSPPPRTPSVLPLAVPVLVMRTAQLSGPFIDQDHESLPRDQFAQKPQENAVAGDFGEQEMELALSKLAALKKRADVVPAPGNREYNPGWHTALDLQNLMTVSEAVTRSALERKESRGAHFRDDYPAKEAAYGSFNTLIRKAPDGSMQIFREPIVPLNEEQKQIIEEMK